MLDERTGISALVVGDEEVKSLLSAGVIANGEHSSNNMPIFFDAAVRLRAKGALDALETTCRE